MVYNPPVEKGEDGEPKKDGGVALTHPVNPMRRGAYVEQATRASGWAAMYVLGWLLMRLSCYAGLPDDCNLPSEPLEVLTVLLVLLVFSLAQVRAFGGRGGWDDGHPTAPLWSRVDAWLSPKGTHQIRLALQCSWIALGIYFFFVFEKLERRHTTGVCPCFVQTNRQPGRVTECF